MTTATARTWGDLLHQYEEAISAIERRTDRFIDEEGRDGSLTARKYLALVHLARASRQALRETIAGMKEAPR